MVRNETPYEITVYTRDDFTYCKQVYEWHVKKEDYKQQLSDYYLNRLEHFSAGWGNLKDHWTN